MMSTRNFYNAMTPGSSLNPGPNNKRNKEQKKSNIKSPIQVPLRNEKSSDDTPQFRYDSWQVRLQADSR